MSTTPTPDSPAPASAMPDAALPANVIPETERTALDAHGHDPAAYKWVPVLKKRRVDGWSPEKQRRFIEELADTGSVLTAAQTVNMSRASAYALRRSPGAEAFDRAWAAAIDAASKRLLDDAFERALVGSDEPIFDRDGRRVGRRLRQSDKLLMFLLRAYSPDRFRHAINDSIPATEPPPPPLTRVADALVMLDPAPPADPAALLPPDELALELECADLADGVLPHWYRDTSLDPVPATKASPNEEEFEALLEAAKRAISGRGDHDPLPDDGPGDGPGD
jgi:hypothetical protein